MSCFRILGTILVAAGFFWCGDWTVDAQCEKKSYNVTVNEDHCSKMKVTLFACFGYCASWTQPVDSPPLYFEEDVNCCMAVKFSSLNITFYCNSGQHKKTVKVIEECECSPCIRGGKPSIPLRNEAEDL